MAGGIYEQSEWPDSRWDCVTVCDGCHTVVWGTFWDDYDSAARERAVASLLLAGSPAGGGGAMV